MSGTITIDGARAGDAAKYLDERNKGVIFKICEPFIDCIRKIKNTWINHSKDLDVVIPLYNLIEYSNDYSNTSGSLWQCYRDETAVAIVNSGSFNSKIRITGRPVLIVIQKMLKVPLKCLSNFWRSPEMLLINCEIDLKLTWSEDCVIFSTTGMTKFPVTKTSVRVATLSTQENVTLLKQLKSGFKRKIDRNKYQPKVSIERQNQYSDYLSNPSFLGVNRFFVLLFENKADRKAHKGYLLPNVGINITMLCLMDKTVLNNYLRKIK